MASLTTQFFGIELKSPVVAASCSLTGNIEQIENLAKAGAGAIVLKSLFEEEIDAQLQEELSERKALEPDPEYMDYFDYIIKDENLKNYTNLIKQAKQAVDVPVIASVSCISASDWVVFSRKLEEAGADALELNLFLLPADISRDSAANEQFYFNAITKVLENVGIPVTIKISHYFSNLGQMIQKLSKTGIAGITLFNRFYAPDIDILNEQVVTADVLSQVSDYQMPLRWIGLMADQVDCPLAATTGVHTAETAIKMLLAGAGVVQVASVLYQEGPDYIAKMNEQLKSWMDKKGYGRINDFKGKLANKKKDVVIYERAQFMKYFGGKSYS